MFSRALGRASALALIYDHISRTTARRSGEIMRLFRRAVHLYRAHGFSAAEIIENGLLDPALGDDELAFYASRREQLAFIERHVPASYYCLTADQTVALAHCRMNGLPVPELVAVYAEPAGFAPGGPSLGTREEWIAFLDRALPEHFFTKPAVGMLGQGAAAFRREGGVIVNESDGSRLDLPQLHAWLGETAARLARGFRHYGASLGLTRPTARILIQKRLFAHPEIVRLTGSRGLSCLRLVTFVGKDLEPRIIAMAMKLIAGNSVTDNFHKGQTGNIWATLGDDGRIRRAHGPISATGAYERVTRHPVTGEDLGSFRVPFWDEARDLALAAARAFLPHPLIGWDIAVTPEGPVIIEGNTRWTILPAPLRVKLATLE